MYVRIRGQRLKGYWLKHVMLDKYGRKSIEGLNDIKHFNILTNKSAQQQIYEIKLRSSHLSFIFMTPSILMLLKC